MYDHIRDRLVVIFNKFVLGIISRPCAFLTTDLHSKLRAGKSALQESGWRSVYTGHVRA